jgi:uncharacterized integral membrane protein
MFIALFCTFWKTKIGIFVPPLLDSHLSNVYSSFFRVTMSCNAKLIMVLFCFQNIYSPLVMDENEHLCHLVIQPK